MTTRSLCAALSSLALLASLLAGEAFASRPAEPALVEAVRGNDLPAVVSALRRGADPNGRDPEGLTPLMIASGLGNPQMVELLLAAGADVHQLDTRMGASPLHKAAQGGVVEVAQLLLRHGAFIDIQSPTLGHTPLFDAVWHKKTRMVAFLLEQGAKTTLRTHYGAVPLDGARRDHLDAIVALIEAADRRRSELAAGQPLAAAVAANDLEAVKRLVRSGADVNERTPMVGSPDDGHTPLLLASRAGLSDVVRDLLQAGADPRLVDGLIKATPGHKAGYMGHADVARLLVESRLELDAQGPYNGYTALHDAVWHGHTATAKVYLDAGARLDLKGHDGRTPLDMAREEGYPDIVAMIEARQRGAGPAGENALRAFVFEWFGQLDRQADPATFVAQLSPTDLEMKFPERTLRSHSDFVDWYAGIRKAIRENAHEISDVDCGRADDGTWTVTLRVRWTATTVDGKQLEMKVRQTWSVEERPGGRFRIRRYVVEV